MTCAGVGSFLIAAIWIAPGGAVMQGMRPPYCGKWSCAQCKAYKAHKLAIRLLETVGTEKPLWLAQAPPSARDAARTLCKRGSGGRLMLQLVETDLHICDGDWIEGLKSATQMVVTDPVSAAEALEDPALPLVRLGRWSGSWTHTEPEPPKVPLAIPFANHDQMMVFATSFGLDPSTFSTKSQVVSDDPDYIVRLSAYWKEFKSTW